MFFLLGMHNLHHLKHCEFAFVSFSRLTKRQKVFVEPSAGWVMDSAGFSIIEANGEYPDEPEVYAAKASRWVSPKLLGVISQDYMCEPHILKKTGLTVLEHQEKTIQRFQKIKDCWDVLRGDETDWPPIIPVVQGWTVSDYQRHVLMYGNLIPHGAWVGVGSICKRQGNLKLVREILGAIKALRPDIRIHAFGLKITALKDPEIRKLIFSADSMSWSFQARKQGRDPNSYEEALNFYDKVSEMIGDDHG